MNSEAPTRTTGPVDELIVRLAGIYERLGFTPARALASARADFAEELAGAAEAPRARTA